MVRSDKAITNTTKVPFKYKLEPNMIITIMPGESVDAHAYPEIADALILHNNSQEPRELYDNGTD